MSDYRKIDLSAPALAAAMFAFGAGPATAEPIVDDASGLKVVPPDGYLASRLPARGENGVVVGLKKPDDRDTGCQVGFAAAPQNAGLSQAEINALMKTKEHQQTASTALSMLYETRSVEPFDHDGVTGLALVVDIKPREGIPPRAQEIETMMILMETPKGRTSIVCVGEKASFSERRAEFEELARNVKVPR